MEQFWFIFYPIHDGHVKNMKSRVRSKKNLNLINGIYLFHNIKCLSYDKNIKILLGTQIIVWLQIISMIRKQITISL